MSSDNDRTALVTAVLFFIAVIVAGSLSTGNHPVDVLLIVLGKITWYGFLMVVFGIPVLYLGWNILIAAKHYYGDVKKARKTDSAAPAVLTDMLSSLTEKAKDFLKRTVPPGAEDESQGNKTTAPQEKSGYEEITENEEYNEEDNNGEDDEEDDDDDEDDEEDDSYEDEDKDDNFKDAIFRRD